jgi:hypothetical protein
LPLPLPLELAVSSSLIVTPKPVFNSRIFKGDSKWFRQYLKQRTDDNGIVHDLSYSLPFPISSDHFGNDISLADSSDIPFSFALAPRPNISSLSANFAVQEPTNQFPFPTTYRLKRRPLSTASESDISTWFDQCGIKLGPLLTDSAMASKVKILLFTYQDINTTELSQVPATDLYIHRVRLKEGTLPWCSSHKKELTLRQSYWFQKILNEGIACGIYEQTTTANGHLSDWNAEPTIVVKPGEPEDREMRVTFNYSHVHEDMPGSQLQLTSEVHDYLADPRHSCFMQYNIKHTYWSISVHPQDRHYFAFFADRISQLQPTRMPQGSKSAPFSMNELMLVILGYIPLFNGSGEEPSLLNSSSEDTLPPLKFYFDDIFGGHKSVDKAVHFLESELLPQIKWSQLKLSFKKLRLFYDQVTALSVDHRIHGVIQTKVSCTEKIQSFPVLTELGGVQSFLGTISITRQWVKNFSEITRPLSNLLLKDQPFEWGSQQQASFDLLKAHCSEVVETYRVDFSCPVRLYSDASKYTRGYCITQLRPNPLPLDGQQSEKPIEVPILFDSFVFSSTQCNYRTYKRELCAIVEFCHKYRHYFFSKESSIIFTDHKPLTYFLDSSQLKGIYTHWASELSSLHVSIQWIAGRQNKVTDTLSRTIFPDCDSTDEVLESLGYIDTESQPQWVWKDGKGGYEELLRLRQITEDTTATASSIQPLDPDNTLTSHLITLSHNSEAILTSLL